MSTSPRTCAHTCQPFPSAAKGPPARPVPARRDHARGLRQPPVCRHEPKTFLPKLSQTLVNSRPSLARALTPVNPSIRRKWASSAPCTRPPRPRARPSPALRLPSCTQNFLPNLTQSLAISRLTLVHLYVPLTLQSIGQTGGSNRLPAARSPLRFAQCPCTKTAIYTGAVNHPHHINPMNHSSDRCQPALIHALTPVNPFHPPQKGHQRGPCAATRLPSCAQNFSPNLTQSLAISRVSLVHLYVPFTFQSIGQRDNPYRLPAARTRLRFAQCPCTKTAICAGAGAVNHPHHINCMNHSSNKCQPSLIHALTPVNPSIRRKKATSAARAPPPVCRHAPKISHTISHILS